MLKISKYRNYLILICLIIFRYDIECQNILEIYYNINMGL